MKLELKKFDITKINNDKVIVLIGKRGTGKSFLVKDLLYYHTDVPIGTVVSGTESANKFYGDFVFSNLKKITFWRVSFFLPSSILLY